MTVSSRWKALEIQEFDDGAETLLVALFSRMKDSTLPQICADHAKIAARVQHGRTNHSHLLSSPAP
jgi:hypothetical protein